jgi:hypothetical protein
MCQRFEALCLFIFIGGFHLHRRVGTYPPMQMEQTECSEMLAHKIHTPGNYPEESTQHSGTCFKTMKSLDISGFLADI